MITISWLLSLPLSILFATPIGGSYQLILYQCSWWFVSQNNSLFFQVLIDLPMLVQMIIASLFYLLIIAGIVYKVSICIDRKIQFMLFLNLQNGKNIKIVELRITLQLIVMCFYGTCVCIYWQFFDGTYVPYTMLGLAISDSLWLLMNTITPLVYIGFNR